MLNAVILLSVQAAEAVGAEEPAEINKYWYGLVALVVLLLLLFLVTRLNINR